MNGPTVNRAPDLHTHTTFKGLALQMLKKILKKEKDKGEGRRGEGGRGRKRRRREIEMNWHVIKTA